MDSVSILIEKSRQDIIPDGFIQKTYLLNLDKRTDRLKKVSKEIKKLGIPFERFPAISKEIAWKGFNDSYKSIFEQSAQLKNILVIEDDCQFLDLTHLPIAINELPTDFDAFYLGSNLQNYHTKKVGEYLYKLDSGWTTHAVVYSQKFRKWCLDNWDDELVFDDFLKNSQPKKRCFIVCPMVATQSKGFSDIQGRIVDYTEVFEVSQQKFA